MSNSLWTLSSSRLIQYTQWSLNTTNEQHNVHHSSGPHANSSSWTLWFSLPNREPRAYLLIPVTGTVHSVEFPLLEAVQGPCSGRCAHISDRDRSEPCPVSSSFLDVLMVKQPAAWSGHLSIVWRSAVSWITRRGNTICQICSKHRPRFHTLINISYLILREFYKHHKVSVGCFRQLCMCLVC